MSEWEDAPTPVVTSTVSSEWETAPIPEPISRADLIPGTPKQPIYKEPTIGEKVVGLGEAALTLGTGALAFPAGLASGLSQLTLGRFTERGSSNQAAEETMKDVMGRYTYVPRTEAGKEAVQGMETIARESGAAGLMPGLVPYVPAMGAGATKFIQDRLPSRVKGELPIKEGTIPTVEQPVTPEITPEVPVRSSVDTTLEQWQTEVANEAPIVKPVEPSVEAVAPLEGAGTSEGISVPQEGVTEGLKPSVETPGKTPLAKPVKPSIKQQQDIQLVQENLNPEAKIALEQQLGRPLGNKDYQDLITALNKRAEGVITEDAGFRQLFGDNLDHVQKELNPIKETEIESVLFKSSEDMTPEELQGVGQEEQLLEGITYVKSKSGDPLLMDPVYPDAIAERIATENARNPDMIFEGVSARSEGIDSNKIIIKGSPKVDRETTEFTFQDLQRLSVDQDIVRTSTDRGVGADPQGGWVFFKQGDKLFKKRVGRAEDGIVHFEMENGQVFSVPAYKLAYVGRGKEQRSSRNVQNIEGKQVTSEVITPKHQTVMSALSSILTHGQVKSAYVLSKTGKKVDVLSKEGLSELKIGDKTFSELAKEHKDALKLTEERIEKAELKQAMSRIDPLQVKARREVLEVRLKKAKEAGNYKAEMAALRAISTIKEDLARVLVQEDRMKRQIETEWEVPGEKPVKVDGSSTEARRLQELAGRAPTAAKPIVPEVTELPVTKDTLDSIQEPAVPKVPGKIPSIYGVVDEADFHAKGKQVLKEQGPEAARKFADNYIRARGTDPILVQQNVNQFISKEIQQHGTTVNAASDLIEKGANNILANERLADIYSQSIVDRVPDSYIRDRMTRALEKERGYDKLYTDKEKRELLYGTGEKNAAGYPDMGYKGRLEGMKRNLTKGKIPKAHTEESYAQAIEKFEIVITKLERAPSEEFAIPLLKEVEARLNKIGTEAKQAGLLEGLRDNYVTHILDWSKSKLSKQEQTDFMQKIQEKLAAAPKDSKLVKDFTQKRQFTFLRELEKMLHEVGGTDHGVVVHTDIAKIVNAYEKAMQTAKIHKSMIDYLKINKDVNGRPWLMKDGDAAKEAKYVSFEGKGARPLRNYRVHPDLADSMNFMFREKDPGMLVRGLGAVSHLTKALNTVGSLFHAKSLIEAGGLTSPGLMLKEIFTAGSGTRAALKALKSGDDPLIDLLIREGGLMVKVEDIQRTIVPEVGQFLDNTATKFSKLLKGPNVKLVQHITDPLDKVVLQRLNAFTWDFMHAGQKVNVAKHLFTKMKLKNPDIPDAVLAKEVGDYVNSTFGGLNWLQVANSVQNKYLQALSKKVMNTTGREWAQIVMFAPDWTVSTLRAFTNALPKELSKPKNWHLLEGAKGVYNPKTKGDLARRYVVTTALSWLTLLNGINMMMSDKPIWENKDPTRVEFKDGTSMQAAKHSMEAAHWMMAPDKTLGNKLGFWPKAIFVGTTATAYPSPTAPKLKDPSALGRAKAIALLGMPFQVSSAVQAPEGEAIKRAGLSTMGFPVYGVAGDKLKESQRKGRLEAKEKKLRQMIEESR